VNNDEQINKRNHKHNIITVNSYDTRHGC